ncbi:MAG TPA: alpha/beta hydrolase [Frankiaceae bacterium]|nr:alpha/beta hydrolase [Frankiaceae bacterium]
MTAEALERRTLVVDGLRTPVVLAGPADSAEAVVFVHGNPGSGEEFAPLAAAVGAYGRAVAPDMPGYGTADKPDDFDYTTAGYARHLNGVLDEAGVTRAHLVLHDFGGPWGLTWAAQNLDRAASVTLIDTGVLLNYRWHYLAKIWRTPVVGAAFMATSTKPALKLLLRHGNPRGLPEPFFDRMWANFDRATRRGVRRLYRATPDPAGDSLALHTLLRPQKIPALVVWGARDPYISVDLAYRQRETFPGAEVTVLDDSGHWPHADNPAAVEAAVIPFLRRQLAAASQPDQSTP